MCVVDQSPGDNRSQHCNRAVGKIYPTGENDQVWPIARVPTITLCWMTSDKFPTARNVWVLSENIAQNTTRTPSGPTAGVAMARPSETVPRFKDATAFGWHRLSTRLHRQPDSETIALIPGLSPAILDAELRVLRWKIRKRFVSD